MPTQQELKKGEDWPTLIKELRKKLGLTQEAFCKMYFIELGTLQAWEIARNVPMVSTQAYLLMIATHPRLVRDTLLKYQNKKPPKK
jgi:DNA-binding transcriptional regulator YiaG